MRVPQLLPYAFLIPLAVVTGCGDGTGSFGPKMVSRPAAAAGSVSAEMVSSPSSMIVVGPLAGYPGFSWLPPLGEASAPTGTFDAGLSPSVQICVLDGAACAAGPPLASFTMGAGSEGIRVDAHGEQYMVNWHTGDAGLSAGTHYRISVYTGAGMLLGRADLQAETTAQALKAVDTGAFIPLHIGLTIPIKFRIETGLAATVEVIPGNVQVQLPIPLLVRGVVRDLVGDSVGVPDAWSSADPAVVTIDGNGLITPVAPGQTTIMASSGSITGTATVTVLGTRAWHPVGSGVGPVAYSVIQYGGDLIVGGFLTHAGDQTINGIARWDGAAWHSVGGGLDQVNALAVYNGDLIAGGYFATAGGQPASNIARWDGTAWHALGNGVNGGVSALLVHDGLLIVAGGFSVQVGPGQFTAGVAAWDGTAWHALGNGLGGSGFALTTAQNGDVIVGGYFTSAGGQPASDIARWDGSTWHALGVGTQGLAVQSVASFGGDVIAGGYFSMVGGQSIPYLARWDGSTWYNVGGGVNNAVSALGVFDNRLIVGGAFTQAGSVTVGLVAAWDGSTWDALGTGFPYSTLGLNGPPLAFASVGNDLYAAGQFSTAGGQPAPGIARWGY